MVRSVALLIAAITMSRPGISKQEATAYANALNETAAEGAAREAYEEATAWIEIDRLLAVYSIPRISQVQLIYRARLLDPEVKAGPESAEVGLFSWEEIPWEEMAFPSARWALRHWRETESLADFPPYANPPGEFGNY